MGGFGGAGGARDAWREAPGRGGAGREAVRFGNFGALKNGQRTTSHMELRTTHPLTPLGETAPAKPVPALNLAADG
jgi:hypothetical protein